MRLGPTGKFPLGMAAPDDDGELRLAVGKDAKGNIRIDFGGECTWFAMPPAQAVEFAKMIIKHAEGK
jgi:hypothetical protein